MRRTRLLPLSMLLAPLLVAGCGEDTTGPATGSLHVTTATTGTDLDPDGYVCTIDGSAGGALGTNETATILDIEPGDRVVGLSDLSANCSVVGANPRTLTVVAGSTAETTFHVTCSSTTGALKVSVETTGDTFDPDGYTVTLAGAQSQAVAINDVVTFAGLVPGSHSVELTEVVTNCEVSGANPREVEVVAGDTAEAVFLIDCSLIVVESPLRNERFVDGEPITFTAFLGGGPPVDPSQLEWSSNLDGHLGTGTTLVTDALSIGTHTVTASVLDSEKEISVRVFSDLWALYQSEPAQDEIERILEDFAFIYVTGSGTDESWLVYNDFRFDQESNDPSKVVAVARLDILRHQRFSEPLPIAPAGTTAYEYVRSHVTTIRLRLDCGYNSGGGGGVSLSRGFSVWDSRASGTAQNPEACKTPFANRVLDTYPKKLQLLIHEARHSDPRDPRHAICDNGIAGDLELEDGGGYAWGALYAMWLYKYGLYDPASMQREAKEVALVLLDRICTTPSHSNPLVQAILDELLGG